MREHGRGRQLTPPPLSYLTGHREVAMRATPVVQSAPAEKPYRKMRAIFDNLNKEDMEDLEDPIVVPVGLVEPSATSKQPYVVNKVEEITSSSEPTGEKNKVGDTSPIAHSLSEAAAPISTPEEVEEPIINCVEEDSDIERINHVLVDLTKTLFEGTDEESENPLIMINVEGPILSANINWDSKGSYVLKEKGFFTFEGNLSSRERLWKQKTKDISRRPTYDLRLSGVILIC
ncbi:hypothetical protein SESBI_46954 [Sesbania bispinosa]|nr:hypothetical protein SESBI_46954 [Sesbania bispinosa]